MKNMITTPMKRLAVILSVLLCTVILLAACDKKNNDVTADEQTSEQPSDYSWEEFEALSGEEQLSFQNSFEDSDEFDRWMQQAQEKETTLPWEKEDAKRPSDYSWEEFEKLNGEEQIKFQNSFEDSDEFDRWMQEAQEKETTMPWEKEDAKQPSDYSMEEFEKLNGDEQIKFQQSFDSTEDFNEWLEKSEEKESAAETKKAPEDYTWEEFEALSGEEQIRFQNSFDSSDSFEKWMREAQEKAGYYPWQAEGAKQPSEYTFEEFEALSGEEQIMFQRSFENEDDFDKWLKANGH